MERIFFTIVRWLVLAGATVAFLFLLGGGMYAFSLFDTAQNIKVNQHTPYIRQTPVVIFDKFKSQHQEKLALQEKQRKKIEKYILQVIKNGSSGHGFSMGSMPPNIIKDENATQVATYVSNKLKGQRPLAFDACAQCHGEDGKGMGGASPSLLELPIYHDMAPQTASDAPHSPKKSDASAQKYTDPLKRYSAKVAGSINQYAILVGQEGVSINQLYDFLKDLKKQYSSKTFRVFQKQLEDGIKALLHDAVAQSKNRQQAIKWIDFIDWFAQEFSRQVAQEEQKYQNSYQKYIQEEKRKASQAKQAQAKLTELLIALGATLVVFILLTIILVLLKIEINTRNIKGV